MRILAMVLLVAISVGAHERELLKIQVVDAAPDRPHLARSILHTRQEERPALDAILNGEKVRLICASEKCENLAAGNYEGRVHGASVTINFKEPITGKAKKDSYTIAGSW